MTTTNQRIAEIMGWQECVPRTTILQLYQTHTGIKVHLPDFQNDIGAFFKWCVPYIQQDHATIIVESMYLRGYRVSIQLGTDEAPRYITMDETNPAQAACNAFLEWADGRGK